MRHKNTAEVAVYDEDRLVAVGSVEQVAAELNVRPATIAFYLTPSYERRLAKRKTLTRSRTVVRLDDDEEAA